jgi:signal transduction histidine kinase
MTLRRRIALLVVLGLTVVLVLFGYLSLRSLQDSVDRALHERLVAAQLTARHIDNFLELYLNLLYQGASTGEYDLYDGEVSHERALLERMHATRGDIGREVFLVNLENEVVWAEPASASAWDGSLLETSFLKRVTSMGRGQVSHALRDPSGRPVVVLAVPVWGPEGEVAGALAVVWDLSERLLRGFVESGSLRQTGRAEIVDEMGLVLASSNPTRILQKSDHTDQFADMIKGGRPTVGGCHSCHEDDGTGGEALEPDILAFAPLALAPWGVAIRQLESEALGPTRQLERTLAIAAVIAISVAIWMVWLVTRSVVLPIRELTLASHRIARGDLDSPVDSIGPAEIGELALAFDEMRKRLKESLDKLEVVKAGLESSVERRTRELSALLDVSKALTSSLDLRQLLETVVSRAEDVLTLADAGFVALYDERSGKLHARASWGYSAPADLLTLAPGEGATGQAFLEGKPVLLSSAECVQRCAQSLSAENWARITRMRPRIPVSVMSVPLVLQGRAIGAMTVEYYGGGYSFSQTDLKLAQALADQMAVAVENARLYQEVLEKERLRGDLLEKVISAQEEERRRIARELHDDTCQALAALSISLADVEEALPTSATKVRTHLGQLKSQITSTLRDVRAMALNLRPSMLDDLGLTMAIDWYAKEQVARRGIEVKLELDDPPVHLPPSMETELFRIAQEAMNNAVRHSGADLVTVRLAVEDSSVVLEVEDDGLGFDVDRALSSSGANRRLGVHGMMERAALSGGKLQMESSPGHGTRVRVELPIHRVGGNGL